MCEQLKNSTVTSNYIEEEIEIDVKYIKETEEMKIIVDSGAPMSIVSEKWLEKYLEEMKVGKLRHGKKSCLRKFRFE